MLPPPERAPVKSARKSKGPARRKAARAAAVAAAVTAPAPAGVPVVALPSSLAIRDVAAVAAALRASLAAGVLVVDASAVSTVDTAGLQVLLAAERSARERGIPARWLGPSEPLRRAAAALGVEHALSFGAGL
jgi:anti-anti-sigma regulatory factor